ncbi:DUF308 domain-containing protein [Aliirhizobium terrae]|uniref:DUF308 domain-containing protein n=1 Tax=Terrirhizobium terrae TaxID=2926709 RepID=UPI002577B66C|nr:DUF308 domain-containing protein [Rhizobium sp. CC-CFT758]WJH39338.1 DUF308 domain-containing protein [Rhizobium sp. CC-CFT758]
MPSQVSTQSSWLRSYYFVRAFFSIWWIAIAVAVSGHTALAALLFVIYPAWDAVANLADARSNGGLKANRTQALNVVVSTITTLAVLLAVMKDTHAVLGVFGVWAILSGLLQLATGVTRWRAYGAQWVMILSGAQSALAGGFMITQALGDVPPTILDVAPYAGFGAFYFLVSAIWMTVAASRKTSAKA